MELFKRTGTVAKISARMMDVSQFGDEPGSRHIAGPLHVDVLSGEGLTIPILWDGPAPKIGDRVTITVTADDPPGGGDYYSINVTTPPGGSPAETGRAIVEALKLYEAQAGTAWRDSPSSP